MSFSKLLEQTTVDNVVPEQKLVVIDSRDPLPIAFRTLLLNNIYSAPVYDSVSGTYKGFLDLLDIVMFIVAICDSQPEYKRASAHLYQLLEQLERFDMEHATRVTGLSSQHPIIPIRKGDNLSKVVEIFVVTGAHRIPVMENNKIIKVITQSDLIQWLFKHKNHLPKDLVNQTVKEMGVGFKEVVSVRFDQKALDAFRLMALNKIHAIAVVDEHGCMLSNLSAKDLKVMEEDVLFTKLYKTALELVSEIKSRQSIDAIYPSFCVSPKATLGEIISKLACLKIHRIYIEDEHRQPLGVISLGDILNVIVPAEESK